MPKISKNKLDKNTYDFLSNNLICALTDLNNKKDVTSLMDSLFTQTERLMLAKRLAIAALLERGLSYKKISNLLKVSSVTIGFVKNGIMKNNNPYAQLINKIASKLSIEP
ncbi:MAG: Trp family transcriptional regulator [Patescibacteria group bacterium]